MSTEKQPIVAITMGDPAGIGPEVIVKTLSRPGITDWCTPVVLGDAGVLGKVRRELGGSVEFQIIRRIEDVSHGKRNLISLSNINLDDFQFGAQRTDLGLISTFYIIKAAELAKSGQIDALVTSPIFKAMLQRAGFDYSGHTEVLKAYTKTDFAISMLVCDKLKFTRVTSHRAIRDVPGMLSTDRVHRAILLTHRALVEYFGISSPKIGVCGLNPHAGESGMFGSEERDIIQPACTMAQKEGIRAGAPMGAELLFPAAQRGDFDALVCMYHDQCHIAYGLMDLGVGVNLTLGVPVIRTSPDHEAAYGIAGKGYASEKSMYKAIELAAQIAHRRLEKNHRESPSTSSEPA